MFAEHSLGGALIQVAALGLLAGTQTPARAQAANRPATAPVRDAAQLDSLCDRLGAERFRLRAQATRAIIALGPAVVPRLRARLARETDPEIRYRLRYILDNIAPPRHAALVLRADPGSGLQPGDLVTHVNSQRIRSAVELRRRLRSAPSDALLRVRGSQGPFQVGPDSGLAGLTVCDYAAPRGELIARAVRLYGDGLAERAYATLQEPAGEIPENELPALLRARIAHTAGDQTAALRLLRNYPAAAAPARSGRLWRSPSILDLSGPGKAPLQLEWELLTRGGGASFGSGDPDIRVQRVLVPARRFEDALLASAARWWTDYRQRLGSDASDNRVAGNMLAVSAWMLSELGLQSECARLIRPRSEILKYTWIRAQTDAWLPFFAGDAQRALEQFYPDARRVLQRPLPATNPGSATRNPQVAAMLAFFLYQFPDDPRVPETLELINYAGHAGLGAYARWMLYALREGNYEAVRRDLLALLPNLSDDDALRFARAAALLEYVRGAPDAELMGTIRRRVAAAPPQERAPALAMIDALEHLAAGRAPQARDVLASFADEPELAALRHTAEFLAHPPPTAADHPTLSPTPGRPLLVVPVGRANEQWLILARDRRLLRFDARRSVLTALDTPTPTWFPGPLNWPWIGREESSGRVWVYARRRVLELARGENRALRLNIRTAEIPRFQRYVAPVFSALAEALAATAPAPGENGEFLRAEVRAGREYTTDPDLPEIGLIRVLPQDERIVHLAVRGGPHLLIEPAARRAWSARRIAELLGLPSAPAFFAAALPPAAQDPGDRAPTVMLMSDQGLLRFERATGTFTRLALPGPEPFPPLIPESAPYQRRDPRYLYCARLPADGGQVYRFVVAENRVERVDMINAVLPAGYFNVLQRAALRARIDRRFQSAGLPALDAFIRDATETVARWKAQSNP